MSLGSFLDDADYVEVGGVIYSVNSFHGDVVFMILRPMKRATMRTQYCTITTKCSQICNFFLAQMAEIFSFDLR
jgi:hypothetical protein